ncbi:HD-GYP domain-containing protein [Noviherbaspirillum aridicola]|uniref:HD-GYP domain-containing protein n=1 Tax=Noviherbaspirillum aridicola TaxID=2849687 RepID=A0ABQ4Q5U5_9BURK|nr:HD domain-containing phosphohydrolase [Noviherbaspirillum aridicola]GIZ52568.1 hypothetical protein NCCP691_25820 [Noviherbaspirillum aridicola]
MWTHYKHPEPQRHAPRAHEELPYQPIIDALTAHIALVDRAGTILAVNKAWRRFSDANGNCQSTYGIGTNYLRLLDAIRDARFHASEHDISIATRVAAGLRQVLNGESDKFQLEYPCDSPTERHWFLLTISPFPGHDAVSAIVAHEDLTPLMLANEKALDQSQRLSSSFGNTVEAIARAVEMRDPYTAGHQTQVSRLCDVIGARLGLDEDRRRGLQLGSSIHDIGKIGVPIEILGKPGRLSSPEVEITRNHPQTGYEILKGIEFPWPIAEMVWQHHERLDGSGYPRRLQAARICLEARIIAVADVFDAITAHRPYRPARSTDEGVRELIDGRGTLYDADVVDALLDHLSGPAPAGAPQDHTAKNSDGGSPHATVSDAATSTMHTGETT